MQGDGFLDPVEFLKELYDRELPYLLVGRQALVLLGAPLVTAAYDFFFSPEKEHLDELLELARAKELELPERNPGELPFFSILSDTLKLDFFRCRHYQNREGDTFSFDELYERRKRIPIEDFVIFTPSIEDLIRIKKVRNSPRDREDIKYLQVLAERE